MCQHSTEAGELTGVEAQMVAARADHRRVLERLRDGYAAFAWWLRGTS